MFEWIHDRFKQTLWSLLCQGCGKWHEDHGVIRTCKDWAPLTSSTIKQGSLRDGVSPPHPALSSVLSSHWMFCLGMNPQGPGEKCLASTGQNTICLITSLAAPKSHLVLSNICNWLLSKPAAKLTTSSGRRIYCQAQGQNIWLEVSILPF